MLLSYSILTWRVPSPSHSYTSIASVISLPFSILMDLLPSPTIAPSSFRASTFINHSPTESDLYDTLEDAVACIVFSSSNSPLGPEPVILYFSTTSFLLDSIPRELAKIH